MKPLILGSSSPRRADYLQKLGVDFHQVSLDYDETLCTHQPEFVRALVYSKMQQLRSALQDDASLLPSGCTTSADLGLLLVADTLVILEGEPLGKPEDSEAARSMLQRLSGRVHQVMTGVGLGNFSEEEVLVVTTQVHFRELSANEISAYIATGEPMDKAGAYGLQGLGGSFVLEVQGSVSGVVGLPLAQTQGLLSRWGQPHLFSEAK